MTRELTQYLSLLTTGLAIASCGLYGFTHWFINTGIAIMFIVMIIIGGMASFLATEGIRAYISAKKERNNK